jgi:Tfp pilus assembly ATPase PilU
MNFALYKLYKEGKITAETAVAHSDKPNELEQMMRGVFHGPGYDAV